MLRLLLWKLPSIRWNAATKGDCEPRAGLLFSDMLSELERIADHSVNIAYSMSDEDEDEMLAAENEALATNN